MAALALLSRSTRTARRPSSCWTRWTRRWTRPRREDGCVHQEPVARPGAASEGRHGVPVHRHLAEGLLLRQGGLAGGRQPRRPGRVQQGAHVRPGRVRRVSASAETVEESRRTTTGATRTRDERRFDAIETHLRRKARGRRSVMYPRASSRASSHTSHRTLYRYIAQQAARVFAPLTFSSCSSFSGGADCTMTSRRSISPSSAGEISPLLRLSGRAERLRLDWFFSQPGRGWGRVFLPAPASARGRWHPGPAWARMKRRGRREQSSSFAAAAGGRAIFCWVRARARRRAVRGRGKSVRTFSDDFSKSGAGHLFSILPPASPARGRQSPGRGRREEVCFVRRRARRDPDAARRLPGASAFGGTFGSPRRRRRGPRASPEMHLCGGRARYDDPLGNARSI